MLVVLAALGSAFGAELQLTIALPDSDPVSLRVPNIEVGSAVEVPIRGRHGARYQVTADVQQPHEGWDWQVEFTVSALDGRTQTVMVKPTMQAHSDEQAEFTSGQQELMADVVTVRSPSGAESRYTMYQDVMVTIRWMVKADAS